MLAIHVELYAVAESSLLRASRASPRFAAGRDFDSATSMVFAKLGSESQTRPGLLAEWEFLDQRLSREKEI